MKVKASASLREEIPELQAEYGVMAVNAVVIRAGRGSELLLSGEAAGRKTPPLFEAASLTKTLFAVTALKAAESGDINIDRPIADCFDGEPWSEDERWALITPRHCLSHSSGLANWEKRPLHFSFAPGSSFGYSGEGIYLLQKLLEQVRGERFDAILEKEILKPLRMVNSGAYWKPEMEDKLLPGRSVSGSICKVRNCADCDEVAPEPNAAWSLYTNAEEMSMFAEYVLNEHAGLSSDTFDELMRPQSHASKAISWGLGWGLAEKEPSVIWHWGDNSGFKSFMMLDTDTGDGIIVFTNSDNGALLWRDAVSSMTDAACTEDIWSFVKNAE